MDTTKETWSPAFDPFGERYEVSTLGNVRDLKRNRLLKQTRSTLDAGRPGYMKVTLYPPSGKERHVSVHRLVAVAFIPGDHALDVNHKDLDKTNNDWRNLEWITHAENIRHGMANNFGWRERLIAAGRKRQRPVVSTNEEGEETRYDSLAHAARTLGCATKAGNIHHAIEGARKSYGLSWRYA